MSINLESLTAQLDLAALNHPQYAKRKKAKIENAIQQFLFPTLPDDELRNRVERVTRSLDRLVRATVPLMELSSQIYIEPAINTSNISIFAGDGSEIHEGLGMDYGLLNLSCVGWIRIPSTTHNEIGIQIETKFYFENGFADAMTQFGGTTPEESFSLLRDVAEREFLAQSVIAKKREGPALIMLDGPLEIWGHRQLRGENYRHEVQRAQTAYGKLQHAGVWTIGYIDRPNSRSLLNMLAIASCPENRLSEVRDYAEKEFGGLCDRDILDALLTPGMRSAIFGIAGRSTGLLPGDLSSCCFYINIGDINQTHIARIELPHWIAKASESVECIHALLLDQCRIIPGIYYPYLLTRAHEEAVLTPEARLIVDRLVWDRFGFENSVQDRPKNLAKHLTKRVS